MATQSPCSQELELIALLFLKTYYKSEWRQFSQKNVLCWLHCGQFKLLEKRSILLVVFDKANISITLAWEL